MADWVQAQELGVEQTELFDRTQQQMSESIDSARPAFWNQRYASGETPWTLHAVPAALRSFVKRTQTRGTVLIPGCGTDHAVLQFFRTAGFGVTAIDFSTVAVAQIKKALRNFDGKTIRGDFFTFEFQSRCVAHLLRLRGRLAGSFLYGEEPEPPPYPLSEARAAEIFGKCFRLIHDVKIADSVAMFAGRERWEEWQLAASGATEKALGP